MKSSNYLLILLSVILLAVVGFEVWYLYSNSRPQTLSSTSLPYTTNGLEADEFLNARIEKYGREKTLELLNLVMTAEQKTNQRAIITTVHEGPIAKVERNVQLDGQDLALRLVIGQEQDIITIYYYPEDMAKISFKQSINGQESPFDPQDLQVGDKISVREVYNLKQETLESSTITRL